MNRQRSIFAALTLAALTVTGCEKTEVKSDTVAEGVIFSVAYRSEDGRTEGFTRLNDARAVPGGNGSWNVDAYGRLTHDYLFITTPRQRDLGPQIIPASRLVSIQFGDGGIKQVSENQPKPAN